MEAIILPDSITVHGVEALAERFAAIDASGPVIRLDASHVQHIGAAGVQLILSLEKTLKQAGSILAITEKTPAFTEVFKRLGLTNLEYCQ